MKLILIIFENEIYFFFECEKITHTKKETCNKIKQSYLNLLPRTPQTLDMLCLQVYERILIRIDPLNLQKRKP
jgi:hypothetical protein